MRNSGYFNNIDNYWIQRAEALILDTYGDIVSVADKKKNLIKFGRSEQVQTATKTTLMTLPTGTFNETYVNSNLINKLSSSSTSDTQVLSIEGHTISGSNLTFVVQTLALTGRTQATLSTPLARMTRLRNAGSVDLVGNIYGHENDTVTNGVPDTATKVHCMIRAGENGSEKASTSISATDYWIVTGIYGDVLEKTTSTAEIGFEVRQVGSVFIKEFDYSCANVSPDFRSAPPFVVVPKNSDVRLRALASGANTIVSGGIFGVLAKVIG